MKLALYFCFFNLSLILSVKGQAQKTLENKVVWHKGTIKLKNGKIFEGDISPNFMYDVVVFRTKNDTTKFVVYNPKNVDFFKYYDGVLRKERLIYSLPFGESPQSTFFEKIIELTDYIFLARHYDKPVSFEAQQMMLPIVLDELKSSPEFLNSPLEYLKVSRLDLFFLSHHGDFIYYGSVYSKFIEGEISNRLRKDVLKKVFKENYQTCIKYARKNQLNIDNLEELKTVFEYYNQLTN